MSRKLDRENWGRGGAFTMSSEMRESVEVEGGVSIPNFKPDSNFGIETVSLRKASLRT
jgi:hypothetical protein